MWLVRLLQRSGLVKHLMEGKLFTLYQHPFLREMEKVITVKKEVITVADEGKALANDSLQEPHVPLWGQRARPITALCLCRGDHGAAALRDNGRAPCMPRRPIFDGPLAAQRPAATREITFGLIIRQSHHPGHKRTIGISVVARRGASRGAPRPQSLNPRLRPPYSVQRHHGLKGRVTFFEFK
jgi:hypothetical protein